MSARPGTWRVAEKFTYDTRERRKATRLNRNVDSIVVKRVPRRLIKVGEKAQCFHRLEGWAYCRRIH